MSASQINDLINPARLRLGIKRAFTGDIHEILSELFGNSQRAGARNVQITADDRGFVYQDDGRGLRDKSDFEALYKGLLTLLALRLVWTELPPLV